MFARSPSAGSSREAARITTASHRPSFPLRLLLAYHLREEQTEAVIGQVGQLLLA